MKKLIVFVCNGNIERSPVAEQVLKKILKEKKLSSKFSVASFGLQGTGGTTLPKHNRLALYTAEWKAAQPALEEFHLDISKHRYKKIAPSIMKKASVVIAMDGKVFYQAKNSLRKQFPGYKGKIHQFSKLNPSSKPSEDPHGKTSKAMHRKVIKDIVISLEKNSSKILNWAK